MLVKSTRQLADHVIYKLKRNLSGVHMLRTRRSALTSHICRHTQQVTRSISSSCWCSSPPVARLLDARISIEFIFYFKKITNKFLFFLDLINGNLIKSRKFHAFIWFSKEKLKSRGRETFTILFFLPKDGTAIPWLVGGRYHGDGLGKVAPQQQKSVRSLYPHENFGHQNNSFGRLAGISVQQRHL